MPLWVKRKLKFIIMVNKSATDLVKEAKQGIENLSADQVNEELQKSNVTLIDIRESEDAGVLCRCISTLSQTGI